MTFSGFWLQLAKVVGTCIIPQSVASVSSSDCKHVGRKSLTVHAAERPKIIRNDFNLDFEGCTGPYLEYPILLDGTVFSDRERSLEDDPDRAIAEVVEIERVEEGARAHARIALKFCGVILHAGDDFAKCTPVCDCRGAYRVCSGRRTHFIGDSSARGALVIEVSYANCLVVDTVQHCARVTRHQVPKPSVESKLER